MSFWDGTQWVAEGGADPKRAPSFAARWAATLLMLLGLLAVAVPLQLVLAGGATPGCALSSVERGGTPVIQVDGWGMRHNASYVIRWVEPSITQTQYWWSSSKGLLQQTVLNNQGSGVFTASLFYMGRRGESWEASCTIAV